MNTHATYRHHEYRRPEPLQTESLQVEPAQTAPGEVDVSRLAHDREPSLAQGATPTGGSNRVAWVRPSELAAYAGPMVGRGIDLQAALARRARRMPVTATRSVRQLAPSPAAATSRTSREGLGL